MCCWKFEKGNKQTEFRVEMASSASNIVLWDPGFPSSSFRAFRFCHNLKLTSANPVNKLCFSQPRADLSNWCWNTVGQIRKRNKEDTISDPFKISFVVVVLIKQLLVILHFSVAWSLEFSLYFSKGVGTTWHNLKSVCVWHCFGSVFYLNIVVSFLSQFMLKEFEARRQQHEQLSKGQLRAPGPWNPLSLNQVQKGAQSINEKWIELTDKLNARSTILTKLLSKAPSTRSCCRTYQRK